MAVALSRTRSAHLELPRKSKEQQQEVQKNNVMVQKRVVVPVVYYLCRNGQLEHPHFVEIPLSSPHALFLRDVIHRLNLLRGKSMVSHYSWSSKRSYKNGYVWQDLEKNDLIHPVHGEEYVLKGSEIPKTTSSSTLSAGSKSPELSSFSSTKNNTPQSKNSEYKVYKAELSRELAAADASTQTDEKLRRTKAVIKDKPEIEVEEECSMELSPPSSDSSQETLESLIKSDEKSNASSSSQPIDQATRGINQTAEYCPSGRIMKASSVLMSLISCGSVSFRDCGDTAVNDRGLSLISRDYKPRVLPRVGNQTVGGNDGGKMMEIMERNVSSSFAKMALEDKEYFSGSLIETSNKINYKDDNNPLISLKRSSSYNADRCSQLKLLGGKEVNEAKAKCVPRRQKAQPSNKKDGISEITSITIHSPHNGS